MAKGVEFQGVIVGVGSLKKEKYQIGLTRGAVRPNYSSAQAQHNKDNPNSETKEGGPPEEHMPFKRL